LSRKELRERWSKLFGNTPPSGIRREVIIPFLAYRIQESSEGGLSLAARAKLKSAARQLERQRLFGNRVSHPRMRLGTRICRRWKGEIHEVDVTETGYQYRDHEYGSLSEVARKITGTRWSGPAFFGLKKLQYRRDRNRA